MRAKLVPSSTPIFIYDDEDPVQSESGDNVGGKLTFSDAVFGPDGLAKLQSLHLIDTAEQDAAMELVLFDRDPEDATLTDNVAIDLDTDSNYVVARIPIAAADYVSVGGTAFVTKGDLDINISSNEAGRNLYGALVTTGTPTFTTGCLSIKIGVESVD